MTSAIQTPRTTSLTELFGGIVTNRATDADTVPFPDVHAEATAAADPAPASPAAGTTGSTSTTTTSLKALFGGAAAAPAVAADHGQVPPDLASKPIDPSKLEAWEGMYYDPSTGEAIVQLNRDSELGEKKFLHTGWFFQRPTQTQPKPGGSLEDRSYQSRVSPFGFLSEESTSRLTEMLSGFLPTGAKIQGVGYNGANASFPVSEPQREILVSWGDKTYRFPAGLMAREMCNYTYMDDQGTVRQNSAATLRNAMADFARDA